MFNINLYWTQIFIWILSLTLMKVIVVLIQIGFDKQMRDLGNLMLSVFSKYEFEKLFITIIIYPAFMNAFQIWI